MEFIQTKISEVILIKPDVIEDRRGYFIESYHIEKYTIGGIKCKFVQDNHTKSVQNTLRGLHFQVNFPQAKLLRCLKGKVFDVAVDIRKSSPTLKIVNSKLLASPTIVLGKERELVLTSICETGSYPYPDSAILTEGSS